MQVTVQPIKTEADLSSALNRIAALMGKAEPDTPEGDELDVLLTLAEAYERRHWPVYPPSAIDALKFHMDQHGLKQTDLEPFIGSQGRVSEVLSGKRRLSLDMIRRLNSGLGIPAECLLT